MTAHARPARWTSYVHWAALALIVLVYGQLPDSVRPFDADPLVVLLMAGLAVQAWADGGLPRWHPAFWVLALYLAFCAASSMWADDTARAHASLLRLSKDVVLFGVCTTALAGVTASRRGAWAIVCAGLLTTAVPMYQWATGDYSHDFLGFGGTEYAHLWGSAHGPRATGTLSDPNYFAQSLLPVFALGFGLRWSTTSVVSRAVGGWAMVATLAGILLSYSRGAILGIAVVGILLLLALRPVRRVAVTLVVVGVLAMPFVSGAYAKRVATLGQAVAPSGDFVKEPGFRGRASEALAALAMFRDHPWQGVGVGNYEHHYQSYARTIGLERRTEPREAHSLPLEIAAETGLPGLLLFSTFLAVLFHASYQAWQSRRHADGAHATLIVTAAIAVLGYLTTSLFLHDAYMRQFWIVAAVMHASAVSAGRPA